MSTLESAFLLLLAVTLITWLVRAQRHTDKRYRLVLPVLVAASFAAHGWVDGLRWQLWPAYGLALIVVALGLKPTHQATGHPQHRGARIAGYAFAFILLLVSTFLAIVLPVPEIPPPTGPYSVGTVLFDISDPDRPEVYTPDPDDTRRIMVQVWYPAEPAPGADPAPWLRNVEAFGPALAQALGLPRFVFNYLRLVETNAYPDAPAAGDEAFPVIVYSHGWTGVRHVAVNEVEELASHGYVVAAPDHTYGAMVTVFPDGQIALNNPDAMPPDEPEDEWQKGIELLVDNYAGDVRLVLDELPALLAGTRDTPLAGRLDLDRIGVFGHSTGGGAAVEVCLTSENVDAGLAFDPWVEPVSPPLREQALAMPFMSVRSEAWFERDGENNPILEGILKNAQGPVYDLYIANTKHADFTLLPLLSPLVTVLGRTGTSDMSWPFEGFTRNVIRHVAGETGTLDGKRMLQVVDDLLVAFFDAHLRGRPEALPENLEALHPEIKNAS